MPRIASCEYCDYRHIAPDHCIKPECRHYWAMLDQNELIEEQNRLLRDQQYKPDDIIKPEKRYPEKSPTIYLIKDADKKLNQEQKGGMNVKPRRDETESV